MTAPAALGAPPAQRLTALDLASTAAGVGILLIFSQFWEFLIFGASPDAGASATIRNLYLPTYAAAAALLALRFRPAFRSMLRQPFLIVLLAIVAASALWSAAPDQTLRRVFACYCTTLCGVVMAARWRWASLAEVIAAAFAILAVIGLIAGLLFPSIGRMSELFPGAWRGTWSEKNAFGGVMAFGFVACGAAAMLNPKRVLPWAGAAFLCLAMVVASTSKTSLLSALIGGAGIGFVFVVRRGPSQGVAATWAALLGLAMIAGVILFASDVFFEILGKDATLTGRTKIWAAIMRQIEANPWLGYGYDVVWDQEGRWTPLAWITHDAGFRAHHAHNAWLEQWLGLGMPGLVVWSLFFGQTLVMGILAVYRDRGAYLAFPFVLVYGLMTLTESIGVTYNDMRWVIFIAIAMKLGFPDRELER